MDNINNEIWLPVNGSNGKYEVSSFGRVRNCKKMTILKGNKNGNGYLLVGVLMNQKRITISIHRLVALHFIHRDDGKDQVNHIDGNKKHNCISNLEWVDQSENIRHAIRIGLIKPIPIGVMTPCCFPPKKVIDTKTGKVWPSARSASRGLSIKYSTIKSWLSGDRKNKSTLKYI